ncbi:MAG: hypothetical protein M1834_006715 [Cirrosporium novae-zelandiae]|nr:MAG: hypothetical protein M1834_006715 [Cirrosporium novae-zelandiae]
MSTAAAASVTSPRSSWNSRPPSRSHQLSSTTPAGLSSRTPASVSSAAQGQATSPQPTDPRTPSPNYFGIIVESHNPAESDAGPYARKNWALPSSSVRSAAAPSPRPVPVDQRPEFAAFRRQSEKNGFNLSLGALSQFASPQPRRPGVERLASSTVDQESGQLSPGRAQQKGDETQGTDGSMDVNPISQSRIQGQTNELSPFPSISRARFNASPQSFEDIDHAPRPLGQSIPLDDRMPRLSLPHVTLPNEIDNRPSISSNLKQVQRADTLPPSFDKNSPSMMLPQDLAKLLQTMPREVLLLDLRVNPHYAQSRIKDALNLCIPTTLLKRPSFNLQKLADTFSRDAEKKRFAEWRTYKHVIVYDACSRQLKDALSCVNTLKKFTNEGYKGQTSILRGGIAEFSKQHPELMDQNSPRTTTPSANKQTLSIEPPKGGLQIVGGCPLPSSKSAANPFFNNIRQNMDLIGGVGQISIKNPEGMSERARASLPTWLRQICDKQDDGKTASDKFLKIEKDEQKRMEQALTVSYNPTEPGAPKPIQIAGIEKGSKNRYNNIFPYDHSRVRLQDVPNGDCDYVNANHIQSEWSNKHYIATQAPIPSTFNDFWRVVWEQDARVIVMLTAEKEGNQIKSHQYWKTGIYGPLKLKLLSEKRVSLESSTTPMSAVQVKRILGQRRSTNPNSLMEKELAQNHNISPTNELPHATVRTFALTHSELPFAKMREITQLQYTNWPDFGAPANAGQLLGLVEHCNNLVQSIRSPTVTRSTFEPESEGGRPIVVHCSAGCGRTGTFCTVDSVVDMLKRQLSVKMRPAERDNEQMDIDQPDDWVNNDDVDLVAKTVEDFRNQRLSMVQSLRQFVLCYEAVLQWYVDQLPPQMRKGITKEEARRSYQG